MVAGNIPRSCACRKNQKTCSSATIATRSWRSSFSRIERRAMADNDIVSTNLTALVGEVTVAIVQADKTAKTEHERARPSAVSRSQQGACNKGRRRVRRLRNSVPCCRDCKGVSRRFTHLNTAQRWEATFVEVEARSDAAAENVCKVSSWSPKLSRFLRTPSRLTKRFTRQCRGTHR